ncbi:hypothetical protein K431DRAFT_286195 [Polychaeton citri CBS 116435]|uniref:Uncharacterized protein n=1 Tax=Polychaeton citri CBS 116435 TaxID=1314669 RepID=A0A9P4ULE2_9PEZI|nr:hypothetical protein K431DRAFT_286195 [Polychaeton citri CBS 116435]
MKRTSPNGRFVCLEDSVWRNSHPLGFGQSRTLNSRPISSMRRQPVIIIRRDILIVGGRSTPDLTKFIIGPILGTIFTVQVVLETLTGIMYTVKIVRANIRARERE